MWILAVIVLCLSLLIANCHAATLQGVIQLKPPSFLQHSKHIRLESQTVHVQLFQLSLDHNQKPIIPSVDFFYKAKPTLVSSLPISSQKSIPFQISSLSKNSYYALFSFVSTSSNDPQYLYGMVGWYTNSSLCEWLTPIFIQQETNVLKEGSIVIEGKTPFFANPKQPTTHAFGQLKLIKNRAVLQLKSNNPRNRGIAHGFLIGQQIIELFRFFLLQYYLQPYSCSAYKEFVAPQFLDKNQMFYSNDFLEEANGVVEGMKQAKISLYIPELSRNFSLVDVLAINGYTELPHFLEQKIQKPACTQFAMWGNSTIQSPLQGGIMGARNMDGEIDIRKTTVSHFLLFAIDSQSSLQYRFVSFMFPGFIGTLSGINEKGFYTMVNFGQSHSNIQFKNVTMATEIVRQLLWQTNGLTTTANQVDLFLRQQFSSATGGICGNSCVIFMITNDSFKLKTTDASSPAFVYEGDFLGGMMRLAGQVEPLEIQSGIVASNHYQLYGVDPLTGSFINFNHTVYYSSLWRFTVASQFMRATVLQQNHEYQSMLRLLQMTCHGSSEHSILYYPQQGKVMFYVFVANEKSTMPWDAPYEEPTLFEFKECFV